MPNGSIYAPRPVKGRRYFQITNTPPPQPAEPRLTCKRCDRPLSLRRHNSTGLCHLCNRERFRNYSWARRMALPAVYTEPDNKESR